MSNDQKGLEFQFLESWNGWDEMGVGALFFYNAKPNQYLAKLMKEPEKMNGAYLDISTNIFEVYDFDGEVLATFAVEAYLNPI